MMPLECIPYDAGRCGTWYPCSTTCPVVDGACGDDDYVSGECDTLDADGNVSIACWYSFDEAWIAETDGMHERIYPTYWRYRERI